MYSNAVTTVSPTYAHEAVHGGAAGYLGSTLAAPRVRPKFHGILNGIDAGLWDPERDPWIPAGFSAADLAGKQLCKRQALPDLMLSHSGAESRVSVFILHASQIFHSLQIAS